MNTITNFSPYINQSLQFLTQISQHTHFQIAILVLTVLLGFLLGRLMHEKKLTNLLDMVNDADTTRKQISLKLNKTKESIKQTEKKRKLLLGITLFLLLANVALFYITNSIDLKFMGGSTTVIVFMWSIYFGRSKYLNWSKKSMEQNIRKTSMNAEAQIKQILQILGDGVGNKMKTIFIQDIEEQWVKQSKQKCRLAKCSNEKAAYNQLFSLYEKIINEIKQISLCDICLQQQNISIQKLGINQFQNMLKNCRKALANKLNLQQKKQIVNRLLMEYQKMYDKLQYICKKGCCIRQRTLIESSKAKHHQGLKRAMNSLHQ